MAQPHFLKCTFDQNEILMGLHYIYHILDHVIIICYVPSDLFYSHNVTMTK